VRSQEPVPKVGAAGWKEYGRLRLFLRPYTARLVWILGISLAATALGLVQPFLSNVLIDCAGTGMPSAGWRD